MILKDFSSSQNAHCSAEVIRTTVAKPLSSALTA
ncbi:hypothetical protein M2157_008292 [Streptomyces sp. SAI-127]|nr:hypothetical protein [Streptomyces sp. SAI-127]